MRTRRAAADGRGLRATPRRRSPSCSRPTRRPRAWRAFAREARSRAWAVSERRWRATSRCRRPPHRQLQRLLRRPPERRARDGRGRPDRRADRRLPRRADADDPAEGPAEATRRSATRAPSCASSRRSRHAACERGIRIVVNAGGLNPAGLRRARRARSTSGSACARAVAHIEGDDLLPQLADAAGARASRSRTSTRACRSPRCASAGADRQRLPRRLGHRRGARARRRRRDLPARHRRRARRSARRRGSSAGRATTGTGSRPASSPATSSSAARSAPAATTPSSSEVPGLEHPGFPIAEMHADGSFVVTKHPGTGGLVSVGTVTAQLLYEIAGPRYPNPDVDGALRHHPARAGGARPRARLAASRGEPPPPTTKVCINYFGGYRNSMTFVLDRASTSRRRRELAEETLWKLRRRPRALRRDARHAAARRPARSRQQRGGLRATCTITREGSRRAEGRPRVRRTRSSRWRSRATRASS